jgi:hypothetical protein
MKEFWAKKKNKKAPAAAKAPKRKRARPAQAVAELTGPTEGAM